MKNVSVSKRSFWHMGQSLRNWVARRPRLAILLCALCTLIASGLFAWSWLYAFRGTPPATASPQAKTVKPAVVEPKKFYAPLTGNEVADETATKRTVTAIMIENSPSARPQSGLKDAGVVFEAIAEGGITRYLTLHQDDRPGLIGPVRSLRPYYIDWLAPFDAPVAHVGGSANALGTIRNGSFRDIDQFFNGGSYWRATDRAAPHNVYTNSDKLDALNKAKGFTSSSFTAWPRKQDAPAAAPTAAHLNIDVSSALYNVSYDYDKTTNRYQRTLGGAAHNDREGGRIAPKVVIALKVPSSIGFEDGYREQMSTTGYNKAYIFQDGTVTEGFWRKPNQRAQIQFYDQNALPVYFNAGQTWITVATPDKKVSWQ